MRQSTIIAATICRLFALILAGWAGTKFLFWASEPLAAWIHRYQEESWHGFPYDLLLYLAVAAAAYAASLPAARAATAPSEYPLGTAVAFTAIRVVAFVCIVPSVLSALLDLFQIYLDHQQYEGAQGISMWSQARFRLRSVFTTSVGIAFVSLFWLFARQIAHSITRRFYSSPIA